jgi:FSR family fosmidomycin resistance protein-like MFS transporter
LRLIPFGIISSTVLYFRLKNIEIRKDFKKTELTIGYKSTFIKFLPVFINLAGITLFRAAMKAALTLYLPVYLTDKGATLWYAGISLALLQLAGAVGTYVSGTFSDKIGRRTTLVIITIVSPIFMWIFISMNGVFTLPILIIIGLFLVAPTSVNLAIVHEMDTEHTAFVNSIFMTINFVMSSLMLMLVGVSADLIGLDLTYKLSAGIAFIAIFFAFRVPKKKKEV